MSSGVTPSYQAYTCNDCGDPLFWHPKVVSQKTGKKIPLDENGTFHYETCSARNFSSSVPQKQEKQAQKQEILKKEEVPGLVKDAPFQGAEGISEAQQVVNRQIFLRLETIEKTVGQRLDRIDKSIMMIARAIEAMKVYFDSNEVQAQAEEAYDQAKEDGLV
jgi:hypothetical protein